MKTRYGAQLPDTPSPAVRPQDVAGGVSRQGLGGSGSSPYGAWPFFLILPSLLIERVTVSRAEGGFLRSSEANGVIGHSSPFQLNPNIAA